MSIAVFSAQQTQQLFDLFSAMTDYYAGDPMTPELRNSPSI